MLVLAALLVVLGIRWAMRPKPSPVTYQTIAVDRGPIAAKVTANGTLSALVTVKVGSQVSGRIQSLGADFGSTVHAGQVIATIEPSLLKAAAAQAKANYHAARAALERASAQDLNATRQFERAVTLEREGVLSAIERDNAESAMRVARAEVQLAQANVQQTAAARDQAQLNLRYTTIVSPIDGIVISRDVDIGQTVAAALQAPTLFTIAQDLTRMQVDTNVAEADIGKIRERMPVEFSVDSYPERRFQGIVRQVRDNAQTIQNVVTYDAVVEVDNAERLLKPGMTASVTFVYAQKGDVLRVGNAALRFHPDAATVAAMGGQQPPNTTGQRSVWVLQGERAVLRRVQLGITDGTYTELASAELARGDRVVIDATLADAKRQGSQP
ncbi:MAG TPA: efflux RND transporter periplasmic adaptor subunit [Polyangiaceae bacterium]|nr:efflux RND transporter periplasmic adaptor subunit [Polyangiaceae bacterium]